VEQAPVWLKVNGQLRQSARVSDMSWSVPEIIANLSSYFRLEPGDLIFTGTPEGVGPVMAGDVIEAGVDGLGSLSLRII
jgi:fumarylpyruvate hydrolase